MAFKGNGVKNSFAAFNNSLGTSEDRRNGNLLGRSADSLYSSGNVFAGIGEPDTDTSMNKALDLLREEKPEEKKIDSSLAEEHSKVVKNEEPAAVEKITEPAPIVNEAKEISSDIVKPEKKEAPLPKKEKAAVSPKSPARKKSGKAKDEREEKSIDNFYCGVKMFDDITENSYTERKKKVDYLNDLIHSEIELYEKDKERYIETRRKKIESLKKMDKGDRKSIQVHLYESNSLFLEDVQFDVRANKSQLFCAIIALDTERLEKKKR